MGRIKGSMRPLTVVVVVLILVTLTPFAFLVFVASSTPSAIWAIVWRLQTLSIVGHTVLLMASVTVLAIFIGVPLAWLTTRVNLPFRRAFATLLAMPLLMPSFVMAITVIELYSTGGIIEGWLQSLTGTDIRLSASGFVGATLTLSAITYPYVYVTARATLLKLDYQLEDVSQAAGYGRVKTFMFGTLPFLRPALIASGLLVALYTLSDFGVVALLRYTTFTTVVYQQLQSDVNLVLASGLSLVLALMAAILAFVSVTLWGRHVYHRVSPATARPPQLINARPWRWAGGLICIAVIVLTFGAPLAVLIGWLTKSLDTNTLANLLKPLLGTVVAVISGTALTVVAAYPIALFSVRNAGLWSRMAVALFQIGYGVPGIVVAVAMVLLGITLIPYLYQSILGLALAYTIAFLPVAIGVLATTLKQLDPRLDEMAESLGYSGTRIFLNVRLPLIRQGLLAAVVMVGVLIMKELPIALLLSPIGFGTLATAIWSSAEEAFFARTALAALLLTVAGLPFVYLFMRHSQKQRLI